MILVDASVWIDHVRAPDDMLLNLLQTRTVLTHPFVIGEISLGHVRRRDAVLAELQNLPQSQLAGDDEVLNLILGKKLFGLGIGYIDAHLLASSMLTAGSSIWTRDGRLRAVAEKLGLSAGTA
jgi:predicted nucleic acid-binding protein